MLVQEINLFLVCRCVKPTETFQYTHYTSSHPPGVKRGFIKGEAIRLLRTNSSEKNFPKSLSNFKTRLLVRRYPKNLVERILSEVSFAGRQSALKQKKRTHEQILPFVTTYHPGIKNLKNILMHKWSLIQNQPLLRTTFKKPPIILYKRGKKTCSSEQSFEGTITYTSQTKLHSRESVQACHDCYTLEFSLEKTCDVIGSVHPVRKCSKRSKADQSQSRFGTVQVNRLKQSMSLIFIFCFHDRCLKAICLLV